MVFSVHIFSQKINQMCNLRECCAPYHYIVLQCSSLGLVLSQWVKKDSLKSVECTTSFIYQFVCFFLFSMAAHLCKHRFKSEVATMRCGCQISAIKFEFILCHLPLKACTTYTNLHSHQVSLTNDWCKKEKQEPSCLLRCCVVSGIKQDCKSLCAVNVLCLVRQYL